MNLKRLVLPFLTSLPCIAFSWNATGHMIVAQIAWDHLTPKAKAFCHKLLSDNPNHQDNNFLTAADWADDTKNRTTGPWHYIDNYWSQDGTPVTDQPRSHNVLWAIHHFSQILSDSNASSADRAEALRYVEHFVGDIHQPLHCTSMVDKQFPHGDEGGNLYRFYPQSAAHPKHGAWELHYLWDDGGGLFKYIHRPLSASGKAEVKSLSHMAMGSLSRTNLMDANTDENPKQWMEEGVMLSKTFVYTTPEYRYPSPSYIRKCQSYSLKRVAMAGLRLAKLLNRLIGS